MRKRILKISVILLFLGLLIFPGAKYLFLLRKSSIWQEKDYQELIEHITESKEFEDRVYQVIDSIYPFNKTRTTTKLLYSKFLFNKRVSSSCAEVSYGFVNGIKNQITIGIHLDKDVGPDKCLDCYLNSIDFGNNIMGLRSASQHFYGKKIDKLSNMELKQLIVRSRNPLVR